jgi:outer membrane protein assembly factor BamB
MKASRVAGLTLTLLLQIAVPASRADGSTDWEHFRGPNYNGISDEKDWTDRWPANGPKRLWRTDVGTGFSSIAVAGGLAYTMGNQGNVDTVFCFDAESGTLKWKHSYPCATDPKYYEGGPSATPTVSGGKVYTFSRKGDVLCLDAKTGGAVWSKNIAKTLNLEIPTWGFASSPFVSGKFVVLNAGSVGTCLDATSGDVIWKSDTSASGYSTPVPHEYDGKKCVIMFAAKTVYAVDLETGRRVWSYPWKTDYDVNAADPLPFGDKVFISSGYDHGCALIQISGSKSAKLWQNKNMRCHFNSCLLVDGALYGIDGGAGNDATLKCLDVNTGEVKWKVDNIGTGGVTAANGKMIVLSGQGELMVGEISGAGFNPTSRAQVIGGKCWTVPVLSQGRIYVRNAFGNLICLNVKS